MPSGKMTEGCVKKTWIDILGQNVSRNGSDKDNNRRKSLWALMGFSSKRRVC